MYGTATGTWTDPTSTDKMPILSVNAIAEKPSIEYADQHLRIPAHPHPAVATSSHMTLFGLYVLDSSIFGYLEDDVSSNRRRDGVFEITSALDRLREESGLLGVPIQGQRFNFGSPSHMLSTMHEFHRR